MINEPLLSLIAAPVIFFIVVSHDCSREDFLRIQELAINPLGDRIVNSFFINEYVSFSANFSHFS